jgi:hypothetical protein
MLLTSIPYFIAFSRAGEGWVFTGFLFGVDDGNSYLAKMLAGAEGAWLFRTPYSTLPQNGTLIYFYYLLLGKLTAPPEQHLQLVALYHLFRFGAGAAAILATCDFIARFITREPLRRFGAALAALGGGLGWLLVLAGQDNWLGSLPLDFYSPETFGFLALYGLPHLAAGRALLLWGLLAWLDGNGRRAGWLWLAGSIFNPLIVPAAYAVIGGNFLLTVLRRADWRARFRPTLLAGLIASPMLLYLLAITMFDPFMQAWADQNKITSPHPAHYLVAYGFLLPWAYRGAREFLGRRDPGGWLPALWVILLPVLAYLPLNLQRRLPEGMFVALVILALAPLDRQPSPLRLRSFAPFFLLFPSTLIWLAAGFLASRAPAAPVYIPAAQVDAMLCLREIAAPGDVVLAAKDHGNIIPVFAPVRVVIGHGPETAHFAEIFPRVESFFEGQDPAELRTLAADFGARFLFGEGSVPAFLAAVEPVCQGGGFWVIDISNIIY